MCSRGRDTYQETSAAGIRIVNAPSGYRYHKLTRGLVAAVAGFTEDTHTHTPICTSWKTWMTRIAPDISLLWSFRRQMAHKFLSAGHPVGVQGFTRPLIEHSLIVWGLVIKPPTSESRWPDNHPEVRKTLVDVPRPAGHGSAT